MAVGTTYGTDVGSGITGTGVSGSYDTSRSGMTGSGMTGTSTFGTGASGAGVSSYGTGPSATERMKESLKDTYAQAKEEVHDVSRPDAEERLRAERANMK
jgi:hypothetical protein